MRDWNQANAESDLKYELLMELVVMYGLIFHVSFGPAREDNITHHRVIVRDMAVAGQRAVVC